MRSCSAAAVWQRQHARRSDGLFGAMAKLRSTSITNLRPDLLVSAVNELDDLPEEKWQLLQSDDLMILGLPRHEDMCEPQFAASSEI